MKYKIIASILTALLLLAPSVLLATGPITTTISDTLYTPSGQPYTGQLRISHNAFISPDGYTIPGGITTTNVINGVLNVQVIPTVNSFPMTTDNLYKVDFLSTPGGEEYWMVPQSSSPMTTAQVIVYPPLPPLPSTPSPLNVAQGGTECTNAGCIAGNLGLPTLGATNSFSALNTFPTVNVTSGYQVNGSPLASTNLSDSANLARLNAPIPYSLLTGVPAVFNQTVSANGTAMTQRPTVNFSSNFAVSDSSSPAQTNVALAPTGVTAATYNNPASVTVNNAGQVTAIGSGSATQTDVWFSFTGCAPQNIYNGDATCGGYFTFSPAMPDMSYFVTCTAEVPSSAIGSPSVAPSVGVYLDTTSMIGYVIGFTYSGGSPSGYTPTVMCHAHHS
jgi:hypothetical protein